MPELGDTIAHFRLDAKLGTGGFATVYRARDLRLARDVALKLLHPQFAADEAFLARFDAEARVAAGIRHPNLVTLHDIGATDAGVPFLVMELLEGETLRLLLRRQDAFSLADVATLMAQLAAALDALHARQIVHRDLKPENVIVDGVGHATLMDFGIARSLDAASLTVVGQTVGTPIYMAPEQITGGAIGPGVDRYALGILAYELLSGRPPFTGTPTAVMRAHEAEPPPPLRSLNQRVPAAVATAVERMLAKRPEDRFSSAGEFATILGATIEDETGRLTIRLPSRQETPLAVAVNVALQEAAAVGQPTGTLTLLFTDIEGSTRLLHSLGDRYPSVLAQHRDLLRSTFRTHRGHEVDTQGDAFFAVFARASEAVAAAVAGQRALAAQRWPDETTLRVRMGLHTGEPQPTAEGYAGLDLHRGARIASAAHGGQVLLSQATVELILRNLPEGVTLRDAGEHRLKDLLQPEHLYQLVIDGLPAAFPPLRTLNNRPNNLPLQLTSLVGREREIGQLSTMLRQEGVRLVTLTGTGGSGKTRLGLQVAGTLLEDFSDGVFFINLAPLTDPALVLPTIAQSLGIKETGKRPLLESLKESLQEKQTLLLLDNFEQVLDAAPLLAELLVLCPRLKFLVTSRTALRLRGEQEFPVPPLALPDRANLPPLEVLSHYAAVELFIQRALAVKPDFAVTNETAPAVAEICARLDGLPLAIELAAARAKVLPPRALLARLENRLNVLTGGARDVPERQRTLRGAIAWSHDLLSTEEQALFRRLSVFVGGCSLDAAEAVSAVENTDLLPKRPEQSGALLEAGFEDDHTGFAVLDLVASLIDKSLLRQEEQAGGEPRFLMLETIREYGLEQLTKSGEADLIRRRHAAHFLALAEALEPQFNATPQSSVVNQLEREHDNFRAARHWLSIQTDPEAALRLGVLSGNSGRYAAIGAKDEHGWRAPLLSAANPRQHEQRP